MERWAATVGNMAAVKPTILDVLNEDEFARQYADRLAVSPLLLRSPDEVAKQRQARDQQAQAAQTQGAGANGGARRGGSFEDRGRGWTECPGPDDGSLRCI